jgi:hypothetical protein
VVCHKAQFEGLFCFYYIYVASIKHPRGKLVLFLDNTNTLVDKNENTVQQKMFYAMKELVLCFTKNDLTLIIKIEKTVVMFFHSNQFRLPNKP